MAVYTTPTTEELQRLCQDYAFGGLCDVTPIMAGVTNSNFRLTTTTGAYVLTLFEGQTDDGDLLFFLALMDHLAHAGLPCPRPLRAPDGMALRRVAARPAVIVTLLTGQAATIPDVTQAAAAGALLARLHLAVAEFPLRRPNPMGVQAWRNLALAVDDAATATLCGRAALLVKDWPTGLPQGVVHADFFPDNVLFADGRLSGVLDFYFAAWDTLAYDLAIALNAWAHDDKGNFDRARARALMAAYQAHRPLSQAEITAMPVLFQGAALRFLLTRRLALARHDPTALAVPHDPAVFQNLLNLHCAHPTLIQELL